MCCFCCDGFCCPCKTFLYITNLLGFLASLVALGLAVWFYLDPTIFGGPNDHHEVAIVLMGLAVFFLITTFLGCCGASNKDKCLLCVYLVFCAIALFWVAAICCYIFVEQPDELTTTVGIISLSLLGILLLNFSTALYILISSGHKSKRPASMC